MAIEGKLAPLARRWIALWNSRDLEAILELYAENAEMSSAGIVRLSLNEQGQLHGKEALRKYWSLALARLPNLHFELLEVFESPDSIVVRYNNERGDTICEYLRIDAQEKIIQGSANHIVRAGV